MDEFEPNSINKTCLINTNRGEDDDYCSPSNFYDCPADIDGDETPELNSPINSHNSNTRNDRRDDVDVWDHHLKIPESLSLSLTIPLPPKSVSASSQATKSPPIGASPVGCGIDSSPEAEYGCYTDGGCLTLSPTRVNTVNLYDNDDFFNKAPTLVNEEEDGVIKFNDDNTILLPIGMSETKTIELHDDVPTSQEEKTLAQVQLTPIKSHGLLPAFHGITSPSPPQWPKLSKSISTKRIGVVGLNNTPTVMKKPLLQVQSPMRSVQLKSPSLLSSPTPILLADFRSGFNNNFIRSPIKVRTIKFEEENK